MERGKEGKERRQGEAVYLQKFSKVSPYGCEPLHIQVSIFNRSRDMEGYQNSESRSCDPFMICK